jgi:hypothetical protein
MQTEELIGPEGDMGHPQAYGVIHYLDDSLLDQYFIPVKKLHHKTVSHLFSRVVDIKGHKDNLSDAKKTPNKNWCKVLSCQRSLNIKRLTKIILRLKQMLKTTKGRICQ